MTILVCGSMAYDTIMVFPDRFRNHLLPDQLHILNVCFLTPEMRREFGGTAGNIAYNLKQLGGDPLVMATVGEDIAPYLARLEKLGIGGRDVLAVYRGRPSGKDDASRIPFADPVHCPRRRVNLAVDVRLPNPPGDQLGVLGAEVDDEDTVVMRRLGGIQGDTRSLE